MRGLAWNLSDLTVASSQYDILFCSEILVSDMHHVRVGVAGSRIRSPCLVVPGQVASGSCIRTDGYGVFRQPKFECGCYEMPVFMVCGVRQNFYVISLCRNTA